MAMKQYRVLAAEDSPTQATALRAHLEDAGFAVSLAANGAEALDLMTSEAFDIVVSDVVMPDVDGYALCQAVKAHHPRTPVVLLTSLADPLDVVRALSAGADNFLRKPYEPEDLVNRVRNMLQNKELRDSGRAQMGLELFFLGRRFMINSEREQILDLLVSTFEDLVEVNQRLRSREEELAQAQTELVSRLMETEMERDRLDTVLRSIPGAMAVFDPEGRILNANDSLAELVGVPLSQLRGSVVWDCIQFSDHAGHPVPVEERSLRIALSQGVSACHGTAFELFVDGGDARIPVVARAEPIRDRSGEVVGAVGTLEDLRSLMRHDPVTGLPGHEAAIDWLRVAADAQADDSSLTGIVVVVLDRFERIRQTLPGAACDRFLGSAADRLRRILDSPKVRHRSAQPSAAYLGNGEIALVLPGIHGEADAVVVGETLVEQLTGPVAVGDLEVAVTATAAVGMYRGGDPAVVLASVAADARLASGRGGGRVETSDGTLHADVVEFLRREADLRRAIAEGHLVVHYQPEIRIHGGDVFAVEALVRWEHPERGLLGAGDVIPLAMESGLISAVSWYVTEAAIRDVARWRQELPHCSDLMLSVNVVPEQLAESDVAARLEAMLTAAGLEPSALMLEITEGSVMEDPDAAAAQLHAIKALGVQIAVDDFGTGYSSLMQLRRLPVDVLKVDRQFVDGMLREPADAAIVAGTLRLARALGLQVVAEGVETADQLVQLRILGCDFGQGYHWSKPLAGHEFETWWGEQAVRPAGATNRSTPLEDTDERQDEAIAYLVHELRSPLAVITGYAAMLGEGPPEAREGYAAAILRNAEELDRRLAGLGEANDVLRGRLSVEPEVQDVVELLTPLVADVAAEAGPDRIALKASGPIWASVDAVRLKQAVSNLIVNAAKFSPEATPVTISVTTAADGTVAISVRDRGPGVPSERRHELFRRFARLGAKSKGMGIGLYLAKLIVEAHEGTLDYEDAPGGGAVFTIRLPTLPRSGHIATTRALPPQR